MVNLLTFIGHHPFISGAVIVGVFFGCKYLAAKGYFKKIGLDAKTLKKTFSDMGMQQNQQKEDYSYLGFGNQEEEPEKKTKPKKKKAEPKQEEQKDFFDVKMDSFVGCNEDFFDVGIDDKKDFFGFGQKPQKKTKKKKSKSKKKKSNKQDKIKKILKLISKI